MNRPSLSPIRVPLLAALLLSVPATALFAADWPQWRGPDRDGRSGGATLPSSLPTELRRLWSVEVGEGHSAPVVVGDAVYVFSREGGEEVLRELALGDGSERWRWSVDTPYTRNPAAFFHGKGPKSTPVVVGDSVCSLGISGRLACLDRETGRVRWQEHFEGRFDRSWPDFGTAMSPAVFGGRLIAHVGGVERGSLSAFDLASGEEVWSWAGDAPAYASPILVELAGVEQIVTFGREHIVSVAAANGELLWQMPFTTSYDQSSVTPAVYGSSLVLSGLDGGVFAVEAKPDARGNWNVRRLWRNDEVPMYMSSPVVSGDWVFGLTDKRKGQLFCLDARTGDVAWRSEGREGDNASLVLAGDRLLVLTTEGELVVAPASPDGFAPEARYTVADSQTWAHLAVVDGRVVVKDKTHVSVWSFE
jgi:outer membrane protein assembly factor BamB